ncbi:hypothetical protein CH063_10822 [Colletotrichum higginsianum]|uniref:Uncharacterized protein n=1 Tax=Colletotrichum higginsianum (strain IMI 349063) TaxID=759273 RepID=H1VIZ1_COLHI|nr:hypothetical protein CH063_10822 [Colletotrichum higginsianum]
MRSIITFLALVSAALAVALPEPQRCNPSFNCCTYSETPCNTRGDSCTTLCNDRRDNGHCNDLGAGFLSCDTAWK